MPSETPSSFMWATVTQTSPLRIRVDGQTAALTITPDSLVKGVLLTVGKRVWAQLYGRRVIIHGIAGGLP